MGNNIYQKNAVYSNMLWEVTRQHQSKKNQFPSTKLQINLKFQYLMTKTFTAVTLYHFGNLCLPIQMRSGTNACVSGVWEFEFWLLAFVCYLGFVICIFNINR
jgi:hypothetical protein